MPATKPRASTRKKQSGRAASDTHAVRRARVAAVRKAMRPLGLDAMLVTNARDIRYLTGFSGDSSYALITPSVFCIISDFRFQEELAALKGLASVYIRKGDIIDALREIVAPMSLTAIGFQSESISFSTANQIAKKIGLRRLNPTTGVLARLRQIKSAEELTLIRKAVRVQEQGLLATLEQIDAGMTELEIAAILEYEMKALGSMNPAFDSIVAAGANGSLPHAVPGKAKLKRNSTLLIDWGATIDGYRSDMTRTFALGKWPALMGDVYEIVLEAHFAGIAACGPGAVCGEVDRAARAIIEKAGYGPAFGHSLGHGIGLDVHEGPSLRAKSETVLEPGMVVTIEPGIYLPGVGGVRIEDDIVITERGARSMCSLPKDLRWATLT